MTPALSLSTQCWNQGILIAWSSGEEEIFKQGTFRSFEKKTENSNSENRHQIDMALQSGATNQRCYESTVLPPISSGSLVSLPVSSPFLPFQMWFPPALAPPSLPRLLDPNDPPTPSLPNADSSLYLSLFRMMRRRCIGRIRSSGRC